MDTTELIVEYSCGDFAQSIRQLLPKGKYWQNTENKDLTSLIEGIATDFKQTHDDIELSLLNKGDNSLFGWKIRDYQRLLDGIVGKKNGLVCDNRLSPNLILASLDDDSRNYSVTAWNAFENVRLPHTDISWTYHSTLKYYHQLATCRHIRSRYIYEVLP